jgi:hypothetical protein
MQTIDQQREIHLLALGAMTFRILRQLTQLIFVNGVRLEQEAADQRRLAVVNAAAGDEAQWRQAQK